MKLDPIKKVTISCPVCRTGGIILNVTSKNDTESQNLLTASESFVCPVCKEKFGGAHKLLEAISVYNESVAVLNNYQTIFAVQLN